MHEILCFFEWLNPEIIVQTGGFWLLLLIIFLETGIFFGFFLPGDSLLLTAGLLCGTNYLHVGIHELVFGLILSGFLGSIAGYIFGKKTGHYLFTVRENVFFKKKYLAIAEEYYLKYGNATFVIGRFLPVARTFIPIVAGLAKADITKFLWYNAFGTTLWISFFVLGGYWLKHLFPGIIQHLELIVLLLVLITSTPIILTWVKNNKKNHSKTGVNQ